MSKKKMFSLDILKIIGISLEQADRITGGMIRLEIIPGKKYIMECFKLAKNEKELRFIWNNLGMKMGVIIE